jgi:hypothetical protein
MYSNGASEGKNAGANDGHTEDRETGEEKRCKESTNNGSGGYDRTDEKANRLRVRPTLLHRGSTLHKIRGIKFLPRWKKFFFLDYRET